MAIRTVGVVGSGQMGSGIAQVAACCGMEVTMVDIKQEYLDRGVSAISNSLEKLVSKERMSREDADSAFSRIDSSVELESLSDCDLVVEAIPEVPELKFSTFSKLDSICKPQAILASNTSSISINEIARHTNRADRVIGMHFMNPVPIMKLVEIINGSETSEEVTSQVVSASEEMGKTPLPCIRWSNESVRSRRDEVGDHVVMVWMSRVGMNHPIGPLALADLIGLDTVLHIMHVLEGGIGSDKYAPANLLVEMVERGQLGRKTGAGFYQY